MKARALILSLLTISSTVLLVTAKAQAEIMEMDGTEETVGIEIEDSNFDSAMDELEAVAQQLINGEFSLEAGASKSCASFSGGISYYGKELHGKRTASGEKFNMNALTAAHRSLPMGSCLRVTSVANGKAVVVRVNDRGPFARNKSGQYTRVLDLSKAAAERIGLIQAGHGRAQIDACVGGC